LVSQSEPDQKHSEINAIFLTLSRGSVRGVVVVVWRRGRHPNGPRPATSDGAMARIRQDAGLGRAGTSARAIAPDRGHLRPRAASIPFDAQKQRGVVEAPQIISEKPMDSFDARNAIEIATEI